MSVNILRLSLEENLKRPFRDKNEQNQFSIDMQFVLQTMQLCTPVNACYVYVSLTTATVMHNTPNCYSECPSKRNPIQTVFGDEVRAHCLPLFSAKPVLKKSRPP